MAYDTKQVGSITEIYRGGVHIASYDPVSEETKLTKPEFEKYSLHIARAVNTLLQKQEAPLTKENLDNPREAILRVIADLNKPSIPMGEPLKLLTDEEAAELEKQKANPPFAEATPEVKAAAHALYTVYCGAVGGKAFNGDPLPTAEEFFADTKKTLQSNAWLSVAALSVENAASPATASERSQLLTVRGENARLRDEVTKLRTNTARVNALPERFADVIDLTGAPVQDPALGDLTPAFVAWARENMPPEIFEKRYRNRLKS